MSNSPADLRLLLPTKLGCRAGGVMQRRNRRSVGGRQNSRKKVNPRLVHTASSQSSGRDSRAVHREGYSQRCSCTSRTARSRTSGENFFDLFMAPSSQRLEPPQNPERFSVGAEAT